MIDKLLNTEWFSGRLYILHFVMCIFVFDFNLFVPIFRSAPTPVLFACDEKNLQGSCRLFRRFGRYKADEMQGWSDKIVSFFIAGINFDLFHHPFSTLFFLLILIEGQNSKIRWRRGWFLKLPNKNNIQFRPKKSRTICAFAKVSYKVYL